MSKRSRELALERRQKIDSGSFKSIREKPKQEEKPKSMLCEGTKAIMQNKVSQKDATQRLYEYSKILQ